MDAGGEIGPFRPARPTAPSRGTQKILLATHGSWGDLHPFIALGRALKARGCDVVLASHPDYREKVESTGLVFLPFGASRHTYTTDLRLRPDEIIKRLSSDHGFLIRHLILPYLSSSIRELEGAAADCDLVLGSTFAYAADIAAQLAGKPFTTIALAPTVMMSAYDPPKVHQAPFILAPRNDIARLYNRWVIQAGEQLMAASQSRVREIYRRHGLQAHIGLGGIISRHQTLALYSPHLAAPQPDFPYDTHIVGFPFYDAESGSSAAMPAPLEAFLNSGPPPLVFSLGTAVVYGGETYYRRAIAISRALGERCVILSGPDSPLLSEDRGTDICITAYAPHSLLFPRCRLIIHHGGIGSTAQALRSGRPQLVTPVFGDQFDNARRIRNLGAGLVLDFRHWRPDPAINRLQRLLSDRTFADRASALARQVAREDGASRAAAIVTTP